MEKTKGAAPAGGIMHPRLLFNGWVRTKILFWFPDHSCCCCCLSHHKAEKSLVITVGIEEIQRSYLQRLKLHSFQASQIQSPTWGGMWAPDSTVWVADTCLSLLQRP